ncbi:MAG: adenosylcobinamide-GDP ribazoletransferase [Acidimicrobiaceae bacterium]|nr:adenosylcobinamide-GDP ribazoletransferase [Acidimicrobiaceae bacterium]
MRGAVAFLTPIGKARVPRPSSLLWFPFVGGAIGALLGLLWWGLAKAWPPGVVAALVVAADLALTGMLHVDGLVDCADGLLPPHLPRERRLAVMKESTSGAFGIASAVAVLLLRWVGLVAIKPSVVLLVGIWAGSRAIMAVVATSVPYARPEGGLVSAFIEPAPGNGPRDGRSGPARRNRLVVGLLGAVIALGFCTEWRPIGGTVTILVEVVAATLVVWFARRRIGGFTGDVLGAAGIVGETVALIVAAARW